VLPNLFSIGETLKQFFMFRRSPTYENVYKKEDGSGESIVTGENRKETLHLHLPLPVVLY
jgi:hypothetical protein